jgi:hypothetical protein
LVDICKSFKEENDQLQLNQLQLMAQQPAASSVNTSVQVKNDETLLSEANLCLDRSGRMGMIYATPG